MSIKNSGIFTATGVSFLLLAGQASHAVPQAAPIQLSSHAEIEVITTDATGEQRIRRVLATRVVPGKDVIYVLTFHNVGTEPGDEIAIQNPIPENTVYKMDSAAGAHTRVSFSIDDGENFSSPEQLTITDDDGNTRLARASEYTTIRWHYTKPLLPGAKSSVEFRVVLQ